MARKKNPNLALFIALGGAAAAVVIALLALRLVGKAPPPPPLPPPSVGPRGAAGTLRFGEAYYKGVLEEDAARFGVAAPAPADLAPPLAHAIDLASPQTRTLAPGQTLETAHLRLAAEVTKTWAQSANSQGFRFDHLILHITNQSAIPVAYRVDTTVDDLEKCAAKGALPHNAIALRGHEKISRSECLYHPGQTLTITRIEVIELPEIGYYYTSRLDPSQIGGDKRTSVGHAPPKGKICGLIPWRDIEAGHAQWADVIDFYARHSCDEYPFYTGYTFRTGAGPLPARPPGEDAPPAEDRD